MFNLINLSHVDDTFSRTWKATVMQPDRPGQAQVEVIYHAPGNGITVSGLGGIALETISWEKQHLYNLIMNAEAVKKPEWSDVEAAFFRAIEGLSHRRSYHEVAAPLGWDHPPNPNPRIHVEFYLGDRLVEENEIYLLELANVLADNPTAQARVTLASVKTDPAVGAEAPPTE